MKQTCIEKNTNEQNFYEFHLVDSLFKEQILDPKGNQVVKRFVRIKNILLLSILFFTLNNAFGYNSLTVSDPRTSWYTSNGTIESAFLSVQPKGLYLEYGLYLTFSSKGSNWTTNKDTLEVVLNFDLPENAIITDSWLWIGNDISRAKILDKWSASAIYESIVKRRRDPSILSKKSDIQYELRIFPMVGNETRKVKITYLVPLEWNNEHVTASLPTNIINTSLNKPAVFNIITHHDSTWKNPYIENEQSLIFTNEIDSLQNNYKKVIIPSSKFESNLKIGFDAPLKNGVYFSKTQSGTDGYYQLAMFPSKFMDTKIAKKVAILLDYDASNSPVLKADLLNATKLELLKNLNPTDSFNVLLSNLSIKRYSEKWVAATPTNIQNAFSNLTQYLSSYSNLASLLSNGINFVKENGNNGKIILISNSDQYVNYSVANVLINDIVALMNPKIQIHISDFQSISFNSFYYNNRYYMGNEYFCSNLAKITLGSYQRIASNNSVSDIINQSFKYSSGSINSFDLHTKATNGFCYSRYTLNENKSLTYINDPILQIGKFKGSFPFKIEISGEYNNEVFSNDIEITDSIAFTCDTMASKIWAGQYIQELESNSNSNDVINEIVFQSISDRVLSLYTSFLCLEDSSQYCSNCTDETKIITNVDDFKTNTDSITVFPNPFTNYVTIEIQSSNKSNVKELSIIDLSGKIVYSFNVSNFEANKRNTIKWNGINLNGNTIKAGIYILRYKTSTETKTVKLIKK